MNPPATATTRRRFLRGAATLLPAGLLASRLAWAAPQARAAGRFVFVLLRGALDGLSAAPPVGDADYARLRGELAVAGTPLEGPFALHPALRFMAGRYAARELLVMHAVATPYRERSHFDGQDVLEGGGAVPHTVQSGWLNRALVAAGGTRAGDGAAGGALAGVALGANLPLLMRGPAEVSSWSPSRLAALREETLQRLGDLYAGDAVLSRRLADALASDAVATQAMADERATTASGQVDDVLRAAAGFLRGPQGARVAVLETTGWDTHANEGAGEGQLAQRLGKLDGALATFRDVMGPAWQDTAVLLATEFGRTAAANGTRGTDHGTGAAAFLVGGAVAGGRVLADWPGLSARALYQGRDLAPTLDLRAVLKGILHDHLQVADSSLDTDVFPGSVGVRRVQGLLRG